MANSYKITTTGIISTVDLGDLGIDPIIHPITDYDLILEHGIEIIDIEESDDLKNAIINNYITAEFNGIPITIYNLYKPLDVGSLINNTPRFSEIDLGIIHPSLNFFAYDNLGGKDMTTGYETIEFNQIQDSSDKNNFTLSVGEISFNIAGKYFIRSIVSFDNISGNSRSSGIIHIEYDDGTGYIALDNVNGYSYNRNADNGEGTIAIESFLEIQKNAKIKIVGTRYAGSGNIRTIPNGSSITITPDIQKAPMNTDYRIIDLGEIDNTNKIIGIMDLGEII